MENRKLKRMVVGALLAAVYAVLALVLPMASFGPVQFRFSEALTLLPVFSPVAGIGVTLGCPPAGWPGCRRGCPGGRWPPSGSR